MSRSLLIYPYSNRTENASRIAVAPYPCPLYSFLSTAVHLLERRTAFLRATAIRCRKTKTNGDACFADNTGANVELVRAFCRPGTEWFDPQCKSDHYSGEI